MRNLKKKLLEMKKMKKVIREVFEKFKQKTFGNEKKKWSEKHLRNLKKKLLEMEKILRIEIFEINELKKFTWNNTRE